MESIVINLPNAHKNESIRFIAEHSNLDILTAAI